MRYDVVEHTIYVYKNCAFVCEVRACVLCVCVQCVCVCVCSLSLCVMYVCVVCGCVSVGVGWCPVCPVYVLTNFSVYEKQA